MEAVPRITLDASLRTTKNLTSLCSWPIYSSAVTIPTTSRGELPSYRRCIASTRLIDGEQTITAKICLITFGPVPVFRMADVDVHVPLSPTPSLFNIGTQVVVLIPSFVVRRTCHVPNMFLLTPHRACRCLFLLGCYITGDPLLWVPRHGPVCNLRCGRGDFAMPQRQYSVLDASHGFEADVLGSNPFFCKLCCYWPQPVVPVVRDWFPWLL